MSEARCFGASLKLAQVVVEGLDVGEDAHGVRFTTHDHHVVHLDQTVAAGLQPGVTDREDGKSKNKIKEKQ